MGQFPNSFHGFTWMSKQADAYVVGRFALRDEKLCECDDVLVMSRRDTTHGLSTFPALGPPSANNSPNSTLHRWSNWVERHFCNQDKVRMMVAVTQASTGKFFPSQHNHG